MKEKRYLCDLIISYFKKQSPWIILLPIIILTCITSVILYGVIDNNYKEELKIFTEEDYTYLRESVNTIYDKENNVINLSAIPNDIILSNVNLNKDKTTFTCMVNKKSAFFSVIREPCIFVTISDNGKNIDISRATEKIEVDKKYRIFYTIMNSIGISAFMVFILFIFILPLIESISSRNKFKDIMKAHSSNWTMSFVLFN